jgi:hypothetical protein
MGNVMKIVLAAALALLPLAAIAQQPAGIPHTATETPATCAPSMGLNYVCGPDQPEDLLQIGNSKWLADRQRCQDIEAPVHRSKEARRQNVSRLRRS